MKGEGEEDEGESEIMEREGKRINFCDHVHDQRLIDVVPEFSLFPYDFVFFIVGVIHPILLTDLMITDDISSIPHSLSVGDLIPHPCSTKDLSNTIPTRSPFLKHTHLNLPLPLTSLPVFPSWPWHGTIGSSLLFVFFFPGDEEGRWDAVFDFDTALASYFDFYHPQLLLFCLHLSVLPQKQSTLFDLYRDHTDYIHAHSCTNHNTITLVINLSSSTCVSIRRNDNDINLDIGVLFSTCRKRTHRSTRCPFQPNHEPSQRIVEI